jgi:hypothetical protein
MRLRIQAQNKAGRRRQRSSTARRPNAVVRLTAKPYQILPCCVSLSAAKSLTASGVGIGN